MVEKCQHAMEMAAIFDFRALTKVHITSIIFSGVCVKYITFLALYVDERLNRLDHISM